jgi:NAD+ diphosphatase
VVHVERDGLCEPDERFHFLGLLDGRECWAVDGATDDPDDAALALPLMALYGRLDETRWAVAGMAVQIVDWDRTHRFCGRCGTPTDPADPVSTPPMRARTCPDCGLLAFPRLAPAVITLVEREDGRALLARGVTFAVPMYSCLAGFVEPGETLEAAVHREVREEVGIEISEVSYWGSQPWPFPHSLMIGFRARYAGGELELDKDEIVDAGWYAASELPTIPPGMSIARRLIDDWLSRSP